MADTPRIGFIVLGENEDGETKYLSDKNLMALPKDRAMVFGSATIAAQAMSSFFGVGDTRESYWSGMRLVRVRAYAETVEVTHFVEVDNA